MGRMVPRLVYEVKEMVRCVEWLESMPETILGTHISERAWDYLGERIDGVLKRIGAEMDEEGFFLCYDNDDGPKAELNWWLKKWSLGEIEVREDQ